MRIGELAMTAQVDAETIRYYEKSGLLQPPPREANGYRNYGTPHVERLAFIRHCRSLDMPLAGVKRLLDFVARPEADCGDIDRLIDEQLGRVRERLRSMRVLERQLVLAAAKNRVRVAHKAGGQWPSVLVDKEGAGEAP